jgi:hypothetical protein
MSIVYMLCIDVFNSLSVSTFGIIVQLFVSDYLHALYLMPLVYNFLLNLVYEVFKMTLGEGCQLFVYATINSFALVIIIIYLVNINSRLTLIEKELTRGVSRWRVKWLLKKILMLS